MLNDRDRILLQQALTFLRAGQAAQAGGTLAQLSQPAQQHPDALYLAALASEGLGRVADAEPLFRAAIDRRPGHAGYRNSYALFLSRQGRSGEAVAALEQAVTVAPDHGEAWLNLALLRHERGELDKAAAALDRARSLAPDSPRVLAAAGALAQAQGDGPGARAALTRAVNQSPGDVGALARLATALGQQGDVDAALAALGTAEDAHLATVRADLLADAGRMDEAVAAYRSVAARWPHHAEALTSLAFLLPQLGQPEATLDGFRAALSADAPASLWQAALSAARGSGDAGTLLAWATEAEARFGLAPEWRLARLTALRLEGRFDQALAEARSEQARFPGEPGLANHRAWLALRQGEWDEAETAALAASRMIPREQTAWSLLSVIWRLKGDPRETWLIDYDQLVRTADLVVPFGWGSRAAFLADLRAVLEQRHVTLKAPPEQTLRGGTQTRGELFATTDPVLIAFREALRQTVEEALAGLSPDAGHPFLGRLTGRVRLVGSWSVRLQGQGFHVSHIHPQGWLSSAFYVALPPEVGSGGEAGALTFGTPDANLGLDLAPRRVVIPQAGRLAIFPSYAWHGTVPFQSASPRLTAAFDALPI
ncbi:tetratricopeptide repeat protein [Novosphingobium flavum]|uniref:Tetratricopeptide repeat protein n=1 Tax=Novosphingobium aerophilum TaxID=2839843 RepID=A0A7X1KD55_9SPHN|nr:tetratricopeptide repeat protein [Novosphingobium aerophilum]MBC2652984.1 tetratricopeptide repeat protein [Novosphingobium aerophilum]MBC2663112.1 tetratricopeptide repeat protein [Novosphingobium aerophilum]